MRHSSIYIIKNIINDKVYIGQTTSSIEERFKQHLRRSDNLCYEYKIYQAMRKYRKENFFVEILEENISIDEIDQKEREYIGFYDSYLNGYNSTLGGDGRVFFYDIDIEKVVDFYINKGISTIKIAEKFNVSYNTIIRVLKREGVKIDRNSIKNNEEFIELYMSGLPLKEIATYYDVDVKTVSRKRNKLKLPKRKKV